MLRAWLLASALLLAVSTGAKATILVQPAPQGELPDHVSATFPIFISANAGETLGYVMLTLEIEESPWAEAPIITDIDLTGPGTIFHSVPSQTLYFGAPYDPPTRMLGIEVFADFPTTVPANGILGYVTIQTYDVGFFPLRLTSTDFGPSIFQNPDTGTYPPEQVILQDTTVLVGPEPSAWVLMAVAGLGLIVTRSARRRFEPAR